MNTKNNSSESSNLCDLLPDTLRSNRALQVLDRSLSQDRLAHGILLHGENSSSLENITVNGNYVTAVERPVWQEAGERMSQSSIVVYEIIDGKVKRFWYYPPQ